MMYPKGQSHDNFYNINHLILIHIINDGKESGKMTDLPNGCL
jgi:hypothetical protein